MSTLAPAFCPAVDAALLDRGVALESLPGETPEQRDDRIDTELMALFRDTGLREAFEALHAHAGVRLFQWLRWLLRGRPGHLDPVDLVQDTFVNVYRYAASFRSDHTASFRTWARTIAGNVVRRAQAALPKRRGSSLEALELVDASSGPQLRVVQGEESERLAVAWTLFLQHYLAAFDSLASRDRRALELVEIERLSYAETGRRLSVGPSNMKMIMLRARRRLLARMRASMCIGHAAAIRSERLTA